MAVLNHFGDRNQVCSPRIIFPCRQMREFTPLLHVVGFPGSMLEMTYGYIQEYPLSLSK